MLARQIDSARNAYLFNQVLDVVAENVIGFVSGTFNAHLQPELRVCVSRSSNMSHERFGS